jgi:hypothetical protein
MAKQDKMFLVPDVQEKWHNNSFMN